MEAVVNTIGLVRFPLLAFSQGCAVSVAFAVRHPERVSHLVLYGGFAVGQNKQPNCTAVDRERFATMKTLMRLGWGTDDPTFRQVFTSWQLPAATRDQADAYNELQRLSASPECVLCATGRLPLTLMSATSSQKSKCQPSCSMFRKTAAFQSLSAARLPPGYRGRDLSRCREEITCCWSKIPVWHHSSRSCGHSCAGRHSRSLPDVSIFFSSPKCFH